ncbi:MAG: LytTR family DNA-binding domain-containing protein, partial [Acidobacteriota bacterium]
MSHFRVLAVDDEPLARDTLRDLLAQDPQVELAGEYGDGASALAAIRKERPDIVFLDIEMPERGGLEVLGALQPEELPAIVFVTAYGHHAVNAFELEALDYVVKPFSDERFFAALERAKRRVREQRLGELAGKMASLTAELQGTEASAPTEPRPTYLQRIRVSSGDRTLILKARDVTWIESEDYYARLHTAKGSHLVRNSLAAFEQQLDPARFLRVHRGAIVNLDQIIEIEHLFKGARNVVLEDGTRLRVSRSRRARV